MSYKEESYRLDVNVDGNLNTTTMFTYDEDHNFSGFWFYKNNDKVSYMVNDKGEIVSSNSKSFSLESSTFVRRVNLNEGEIGKIQSVKNNERIVYIGEKVIVGDLSLLYDKNTLEIVKSSNVNYVGKYYVEFNKSRTETGTETGTETIIETIQLIVDSNLKNIIYPDLDQDNPEYNVVTDGIVDGTIGINFNIMNNNNLIYAYRSRNISDSEFVNYSVNDYGTSVIIDNTTLLGIHLTSNVTSIGSNAFYCCTGLTQVTIPNSVTDIGDRAFLNCDGLTQVTIPNGVISIGIGVFNSCTGLTQVTIPEKVTTIGDNAFAGSGLTQVTIPDSVTFIGNNAFEICEGLTQVTIPDSVISIGDRVFYYCEALTEVVINGALTTVGINAFNTGSTLTIYCDDENTKNSILEDAASNGYNVSVKPLDEYYKNK